MHIEIFQFLILNSRYEGQSVKTEERGDSIFSAPETLS